MSEVGYVLWHSLNENGKIKYYDIEWPDGRIDVNVPANLLEKVKDSDDIDEGPPHNEHNHVGHEEDSLVSERRYKKRKYFR